MPQHPDWADPQLPAEGRHRTFCVGVSLVACNSTLPASAPAQWLETAYPMHSTWYVIQEAGVKSTDLELVFVLEFIRSPSTPDKAKVLSGDNRSRVIDVATTRWLALQSVRSVAVASAFGSDHFFDRHSTKWIAEQYISAYVFFTGMALEMPPDLRKQYLVCGSRNEFRGKDDRTLVYTHSDASERNPAWAGSDVKAYDVIVADDKYADFTYSTTHYHPDLYCASCVESGKSPLVASLTWYEIQSKPFVLLFGQA